MNRKLKQLTLVSATVLLLAVPITIKKIQQYNQKQTELYFKQQKELYKKQEFVNSLMEMRKLHLQKEMEKKQLQSSTTEKQQNTESNKQEINIICTFYTGDADENGGYSNLTASGKKLSRGMIATPHDLKFGTKIYIEKFDKFYTVEDRGNSSHIKWVNENTIRIDVYVPTKEEALRLGVIKTKGYIVK